MTANGEKLEWGQHELVPTDARTAWGARLLVTQDGQVDVVPDRMGCAGEDRDEFLLLLTEQFPVPRLLGALFELLTSGHMNTREARDFTLHDSADLEVHANTKASAGYCYVTAWAKKPREGDDA